MKKLVLVALSACLSVLWSCTNEEMPMANEDMVPVQFTFNVEGEMDSRAISDGTGTNQLMYGVYEGNKCVIKKVVKDNVNSKELLGDGYSLTIALLRGRTYQVVFWAQNNNSEAYTVSDDMNVTINYDGINNDETRDAFFATKEVEVNANSSIEVVLKRPFAQINVGAFKSDFEYVQNQFGITIDQSKATIKKVPNQINLLTGVASGETDVNYTLGATPAEDLKNVDVDGNEVLESYKWVSMSYILASNDRSAHDMSFVFSQKNAENSDISFDLTEVPAQRNYRTNIVGQVLSSSCNFSVKIDPIYEDEMIFAGALYYNFTEPTTIKDTEFAFNSPDMGNWAIFTSDNGSEVTLDNVVFSGKLYRVGFGDYNKSGNVAYKNKINNVRAEDIVVGNCVHNESDHMSLLFYVLGQSTVTNCAWTGTTKTAETMYCVTGQHEVDNSVAYDCGVPNKCKATFESCKISSMYVWSQAQVTITGTEEKPSEIDYIRTAALRTSSIDGFLTIGANTTVNELEVTPSSGYKRIVNILAGAHVKTLKLNGHSIDNVTIEAGATVDQIIE